MGQSIATIYALLMVWGYGSQVIQLHRTKNPHGLSLQFFVLTLAAVIIRTATVGFVIWETHNFTAIALAIAEFVVIGGLATVALQIVYYRHLRERLHGKRR